MTADDPYTIVLTPPAVRAIQTTLSEAVAAFAVIEFLTGALVENPQRVGKVLRGDLSGIHSARRGTYRVLYRINEQDHESLSYASTTDVAPIGPIEVSASPQDTETFGTRRSPAGV